MLEFDEVTIMHDANDKVGEIIERAVLESNGSSVMDRFSESDISELNLYYVGVSRARLKLNNARHLI